MTRVLTRPDYALLAIAGLCALALTSAYIVQHGFGLAPCELCLWQRYPYWTILFVAALGLGLARPALALLAVAAALVINVGIAGYHSGIERGLFELPAGCVSGGDAQTVEELRAQLMTAAPTCDQIVFSLLGLSLSNWNALFALALLIGSLVALRRTAMS